MKCPRRETGILEEKDREGITIDLCPQGRGIWLERGEQELLISRALAKEERLRAPETFALD